jgi:hypothetical protein
VAFSLPPVTPELRAAAERTRSRRLSLLSQNQILRQRYDEVMQWVNPPWDPASKRVDPRPEFMSAERVGQPKMHSDWTGQAVMRWAVLQAGAMPTFRFVPRYVPPPLPAGPAQPPEERKLELQLHELDRASAEDQAAQMEAQTKEWLDHAEFHRWWLWTAWSKEAFGKAIARSGWDIDENMPTIELMENPSQCYYAWTSRYGRRRLAWLIVADQMLPEEANFRYGIDLPLDEYGHARYNEWTGIVDDQGDMDTRPEQAEENSRWVWVDESWELDQRVDEDGAAVIVVRNYFVVAGRVVEEHSYEWPRIPFHVFENQHIPTYAHGKSMAEVIISLNEGYDDTLDRQHQIIEFESGPRYKGLNMGFGDETIEVPDPGSILPLREGEDIQQIDTRVDFWPAQVHTTELKESLWYSSGLTPIAWGMSPNAQTSGRALSAEWRAVELPLAGRLIEATPVLHEIIGNWWDYAEEYIPKAHEIARGYRRVQAVWEPLDIRDASERVLSVVQLYQADLMDPETALEKTGTEDIPEKIALLRRYLTDPVWNPLRYQQMLVLKQLELQIQQQEMQMQAMMGQMQGQGGGMVPTGEEPTAEELEAQGINAAVDNAQGPAGPVTEAQNQPGQQPGLPMNIQTLSRTPLEGGSGNQIMLDVGGQSPTNGVAVA